LSRPAQKANFMAVPGPLLPKIKVTEHFPEEVIPCRDAGLRY
jgi:hypothetical protein